MRAVVARGLGHSYKQAVGDAGSRVGLMDHKLVVLAHVGQPGHATAIGQRNRGVGVAQLPLFVARGDGLDDVGVGGATNRARAAHRGVVGDAEALAVDEVELALRDVEERCGAGCGR